MVVANEVMAGPPGFVDHPANGGSPDSGNLAYPLFRWSGRPILQTLLRFE
jgi:hypothetical protein